MYNVILPTSTLPIVQYNNCCATLHIIPSTLAAAVRVSIMYTINNFSKFTGSSSSNVCCNCVFLFFRVNVFVLLNIAEKSRDKETI
jgi:hypothetical protein